MSIESLTPWTPEGPDVYTRRNADGEVVATVSRQHGDFWVWFLSNGDEGQRGDTLCGAQIRANVALASVRRPHQR